MAPFYPEELIQEVIASHDIVDIVSEYVKLKRSGRYLMGLCPFHNEKTPSFSVSPDKQIFYCFGCGAGGTVVNFIMRNENLDFIEAIKFLADRARINLPEGDERGDEAKRYKQKQLIYEINVETARFFHSQLNGPEGESARKYLAKRRISNRTIVHFGMGYAPNAWRALKEHLQSKGFEEADMTRAGLIIDQKQKGSYDRFRNRIIFPIIDLRGNVIGFGGRVLDDSLPKYLNSPETVVFNKSRNLYGLNFAKNASNQTLIIVEGYMDVISLHQNGIINTVASLGTALTKEQAGMIKKYCNEVIIAYDSDAAGQAAVLRGMDVLADAGCRVKVLCLKEGKDPDEFIREKGPERFKRALNESKSLIEYKVELLEQKYDINSIEEKIEFVNQIAEVFAKVENSVERDVYIKKIAEETGIRSEAIIAEIKKNVYKNRRKSSKPVKTVKRNTGYNENIVNEKRNNANNNLNTRLLSAEKMLINLMCDDKSLFNKVKELIRAEDFNHEIHQKIAAIIYTLRENGETIDPVKIVSRFDKDEMQIVASILHAETNFEDDYKAALELINTIHKEKNILKIKESLQEGNVEKLNTLLMEYKNK